ncbi:hypothetical protein [Acaryochloris sp. IP29b_bin.137]|uniref:hypothetical protein n=1 Tax=Acaryochloris sp. IP29b_bin.137 TaxID=2969217 RepID=UPI0026314382|nr:hypothetical protein [Acaryochloris sp. IP29b_bin.137]
MPGYLVAHSVAPPSLSLVSLPEGRIETATVYLESVESAASKTETNKDGEVEAVPDALIKQVASDKVIDVAYD